MGQKHTISEEDGPLVPGSKPDVLAAAWNESVTTTASFPSTIVDDIGSITSTTGITTSAPPTGERVSCSALLVDEGVAGCGGGNTHPDGRRRASTSVLLSSPGPQYLQQPQQQQHVVVDEMPEGYQREQKEMGLPEDHHPSMASLIPPPPVATIVPRSSMTTTAPPLVSSRRPTPTPPTTDDLIGMLNGITTNDSICNTDHPLALAVTTTAGSSIESNRLIAGGVAITDTCAVVVCMLRAEGSMDTQPMGVIKAAIHAVRRLWIAGFRDRLVALNICQVLVGVLVLHIGRIDLMPAGLGAVSVLAAVPDQQDEDPVAIAAATAVRASLGQARCNEMIVAALRVYSGTAEVQVCGCRAIEAMAVDSVNATKMGEAGVVGTMAHLMTVFADDPMTLRHACSALQVLAREFTVMRSLTKAGICDQLLRVLSRFPGERALQESGMMAMLGLMFTADNMRKLGKHGAVDIVVTALQAFPCAPENRSVNEVGLMLVRRLAMDQYNRRRLAKAMAPQVVCRVMREYARDARIQEWACAAISILALDDDMKMTLRTCGAADGAMGALAHFDADRGLSNVAKLALRRLASAEGTTAATSQQQGAGGRGKRGGVVLPPRAPSPLMKGTPAYHADPQAQGGHQLSYSSVARQTDQQLQQQQQERQPEQQQQPAPPVQQGLAAGGDAEGVSSEEALLEQRRLQLKMALDGQYRHLQLLSQQAQLLHNEEKVDYNDTTPPQDQQQQQVTVLLDPAHQLHERQQASSTERPPRPPSPLLLQQQQQQQPIATTVTAQAGTQQGPPRPIMSCLEQAVLHQEQFYRQAIHEYEQQQQQQQHPQHRQATLQGIEASEADRAKACPPRAPSPLVQQQQQSSFTTVNAQSGTQLGPPRPAMPCLEQAVLHQEQFYRQAMEYEQQQQQKQHLQHRQPTSQGIAASEADRSKASLPPPHRGPQDHTAVWFPQQGGSGGSFLRPVDVKELVCALRPTTNHITLLVRADSMLVSASGLLLLTQDHLHHRAPTTNSSQHYDMAQVLVAFLDNSNQSAIMPPGVIAAVLSSVIHFINPHNPNSATNRQRLRSLDLDMAVLRTMNRFSYGQPEVTDGAVAVLCLVASEDGLPQTVETVKAIMSMDAVVPTANPLGFLTTADALFIRPMTRLVNMNHPARVPVHYGCLTLLSAWWTYERETRAVSAAERRPLQYLGGPAFFVKTLAVIISVMRSCYGERPPPHLHCRACLLLSDMAVTDPDTLYPHMLQHGVCQAIDMALRALRPTSPPCCLNHTIRATAVLTSHPAGVVAMRASAGESLIGVCRYHMQLGWDILSVAGAVVLRLAGEEGDGLRQMVQWGAIEAIVTMTCSQGLQDLSWLVRVAAWVHCVARQGGVEPARRLAWVGGLPMCVDLLDSLSGGPEEERSDERTTIQGHVMGALLCMAKNTSCEPAAALDPLVSKLVPLLATALHRSSYYQPTVAACLALLAYLASINTPSSTIDGITIGQRVLTELTPDRRDSQQPSSSDAPGTSSPSQPQHHHHQSRESVAWSINLALRSYPNDRDVQVNGLSLVWMLASHSRTNLMALVTVGAAETTVRIASGGPLASDRDVAFKACAALSSLSDYESKRDWIINAGAIKALVHAMSAFPLDCHVQRYGLCALAKLLYDEEAFRRAGGWENQQQQHEGGVSLQATCAVVLQAVRTYSRDADVQQLGCRGLWVLASSGGQEGRRILAEGGAAEMIVYALWAFPRSKGLQYVACSALVMMLAPDPATRASKLAATAAHTTTTAAKQVVKAASTTPSPLPCSYALIEAALKPYGRDAARAPAEKAEKRGGVLDARRALWRMASSEGEERDEQQQEGREGWEGAMRRRRLTRCGAREAVEEVRREWAADGEVKRAADMALALLMWRE